MESLPLFLSALSECPYLPDRQARNAFVDPRLRLTLQQREALLHMGFRRSGPSHYRPVCPSCQACQSTRLDVTHFVPNRAQRRCYKANHDLIASWSVPAFSDERFDLYQRYLRQRHPDGGMDPDDEHGFRQFLCGHDDSGTRHLMFRDYQGTLLAVAVADRLSSGYSAVYTFFEPTETRRSLGRYAVLRLIQACRAAQLPWLYLGYFVADCDAMQYKAEYRPQQRLIQQQWKTVLD